MKRSADFYKVVNAVINTLNQGDSVAYVTGGQGGSGYGVFDTNEDTEKIRKDLMKYADCEELDEDELLPDWKDEDRNSSDCEFWQLSNYGDNAPCLQVMINPEYYVTSSYVLRDMICDEQNLEAAEITEGMNGYPKGLRGCVLLNDKEATFESMERLAELYGVEVVSLRRKDGWQLWESQGHAYELYDFLNILDSRDDNARTFGSFKEYADYLRETARNLQDSNIVAEMDNRAALDRHADDVADKEIGDNEFIHTSTYDISRYELLDRHVSHYSYDTWNYCLALDCMVTD